MFIGRTGILLLKRGEFGAYIFYLVLAGNYTISEPFEFGVVLPAKGVAEGVKLADVQKLVSEVMAS
jgi:hypothetical protein